MLTFATGLTCTSVPGCSAVNSLPLPSTLCSVEGCHLHSIAEERGFCPTSGGGGHLHNAFGVLLHDRFYLPLLIQSRVCITPYSWVFISHFGLESNTKLFCRSTRPSSGLLGALSGWRLCPFDCSSSCGFIGAGGGGHFLAFWHHEMLQGHDVYFLPPSSNQPFLQGALVSFIGDQGLGAGVQGCYWGVAASRASRLTEQGGVCAYRNLCTYTRLYMFLYVNICIYRKLTMSFCYLQL